MNEGKVPQPKSDKTTNDLPASLTFFVSRKQRTQMIHALKALSKDRVEALMLALDLKSH